MSDKSDNQIRSEIDANLRRAYQKIAQEDLPARFKILIEQLRSNETANDSKSGSSAGPDSGPKLGDGADD